MDNGYVIIGIIALLFLSIYGYAYATVAYENMKGRKAKRKLIRLREERRIMKLSTQTKRDEKVAKLLIRSEEIRHELRVLELKKDLRAKMKLEKMRVSLMKTQMNEQQVG